MSEQKSHLEALETASQLHESETVIELGADRFMHFIAVRLVIILAVVAKLAEVINGNLSCHPANNETRFDKHFIKFAEAYCWESPVIRANYISSHSFTKKKCDIEAQFSGKKLLEHPEAAINVLRWMPFAFLFEAFLFSLPSAWWHFRVGGRLMGHLKFIQLLVARICDQLKDLPAGFLIDLPYDEGSVHLDGWCAKVEDTTVKKVKQTVKDEDKNLKKETMEVLGKIRGAGLKEYISDARTTASTSASKIVEDCRSESNPKSGRAAIEGSGKVRGDGLKEYVDKASSSSSQMSDAHQIESDILEDYKGENKAKSGGKMLDRHLFSNLCYENFSSLEHFPYLLSIIRLTYYAKFDDSEGVFPLNQGILMQWCNEENFGGRFLVYRYYIKHALGILVALAMLRTIAFILECLGGNIWKMDSFRCDVINYEEVFVVCTLHRKTELIAFLLLNLAIVVCYLITAAWQVYFISHARNSESSSFFDYVNDNGSLALLAALREKQRKQALAKKKTA